MNLEAPHAFDGRKVGSPWSCDTKKYGINCQDSMIFSYERERENSFLKCSDWLKLIQSFFWNVLSLEPWKFLGTFRQVNIKRGEKGVEAFRIKGEWQHLSAFAQKSILLQYIKWLQSYGKTYKLWYTIDLLVILELAARSYLPVFCQLTCLRHFHVPNLLGSLMWIGGMLEVLSWWHWRAQQPTEKDTGSLGAMSSTRKEDSRHRQHRH